MPEASDDDEALRWEGDEDQHAPRRPVRTVVEPSPSASAAVEPGAERGAALGLVVFGVLAGVALIETIGWVRSGFGLVLGASLTTGAGTPLEVAAYCINVVFRITAVLAPVVWFGAVAWRVPGGTRRIAWLALGAVLLVPWPVVVLS